MKKKKPYNKFSLIDLGILQAKFLHKSNVTHL